MEQNKELINESYMNWAENFLKDKPGFSSDFYQFNNENVKKEDIQNVKNLEYFFRLTEEYANQNNIKPIIIEGNPFLIKKYYINHQDKIYDIGYISDQNTIFTFSEVLTKKDVETIEFKEIEKFQQNLRKKVHNIKNITTKPNTKTRK